MYLKELTINGFKSFAKKGELEFSAPITAIVGPNGSGKSNVAEAFRFVLGEQSLKSMRGKRGEDLIFSGTQAVSRSNRASVQVVLDNTTRVFSLDYDEITVERVVHRDGQNEYTINGAKVRLKDVQELLSAANIGSTGHHIISQGEADRILSASTKERREMIEDALGLKVYQYKKQEAERKLTKTSANVAQVQQLRKEVAPHLKFLERQIKKMERAVELRNSLATFYAEYLKREDTYIAYHHDRLVLERKHPLAELEKVKAEITKAKAVLAKEADNDASKKSLELQSQLTKVRHLRQEKTRLIGQVEGQINYVKERIRRLKEDSKKTETPPVSGESVREVIVLVEKNINHALNKDDTSILKRALQDVLQVLQSFAHKVLDKAEIDTDNEEKELKSLEKDLSVYTKELEELVAEETIVNDAYEVHHQQIETQKQENHEAEKNLYSLSNTARDYEYELERIDSELTVLERDRDEFKRELQEAVSLLGRDAGLYFEFKVNDEKGNEIQHEDLVKENRTIQRERRRELEKMKIRLEELGGANEDIVKEYKEVKERDEFLEREIADLEKSIASLQSLISDLSAQLNEQFATGIEKIDAEFKKFFQLMFGGGNATLKTIKVKAKAKTTDNEAEDNDEETDESETEEGIELDVSLPNKRVRGLEMLSGGERALTSIALIFAMSQVNPPLFIILDETDAALDEANSRRYGDMIEALAEKSQLILITHNRETMSRAGILYGVTMGADGVSKLLSVKFDEATLVAK